MASSGPYCFYDESLPEWGIDAITLAQDANGDLYFPIRPLCEALAIDRGTQAGIIRNDSRTKAGARDIRIPTSTRGAQPSLCLRRREVAIWLTLIDPNRVGERAKARGRLEEFQAAIWHLADRVVFRGKASADASAIPVPVAATLEGAQRAMTSCPDCGAPLVAEVRDGKHYLWHAGAGVQ